MALVLGLMAGFTTAAMAQDAPCGPDAACTIEGGSYHLIVPNGWDGQTPLPTLVYFHGHNSSGATVFRSGGLKSTFADNGYLIVAPDGERMAGRQTRAWPARPGLSDRRDDVDFVLRVLDDVATRFPVDENRVYSAGFSAGGSMVWMMACYAGERFSGFVSVSGALRRPVPADACPSGPVRLMQIHGFADTQVPLEGRGIGDWHQGDVFESFALMRQTNACRSNPDAIEVGEDFRCRTWSSCDAGALKMCLHDGGHGLPRGWTDMARTWFEATAIAN